MKISKAKKNMRVAFFDRPNTNICINCGRNGSHFVPPSLGDPGFFACAALANEKLSRLLELDKRGSLYANKVY